MDYFINNETTSLKEFRKVQGLVGDSSFSIVLPKSYAVDLSIGKGDFVMVTKIDKTVYLIPEGLTEMAIELFTPIVTREYLPTLLSGNISINYSVQKYKERNYHSKSSVKRLLEKSKVVQCSSIRRLQ